MCLLHICILYVYIYMYVYVIIWKNVCLCMYSIARAQVLDLRKAASQGRFLASHRFLLLNVGALRLVKGDGTAELDE